MDIAEVKEWWKDREVDGEDGGYPLAQAKWVPIIGWLISEHDRLVTACDNHGICELCEDAAVKRADALTAANLDLTERVLYAEMERDEAKEELAKVWAWYKAAAQQAAREAKGSLASVNDAEEEAIAGIKRLTSELARKIKATEAK